MTTRDLTLELASKTEGILILGALTLKQLQAFKTCTFFINQQGIIELADPIEVSIDALPENQAIHRLTVEYKYNDQQLITYLKGRDARLSLLSLSPPTPSTLPPLSTSGPQAEKETP